MTAAANLWPTDRCAKAFWGQCELPPYRELLADTLAAAAPQPGERWLDLGCGQGMLTRGLWERSGGRVREVVGMDCAAVNADAYRRLAADLAAGERVRFVCHDFSAGLGPYPDTGFDGVVSGLAVQYAESIDPVTGGWTDAGYRRLLAEAFRVLRPGGRFVFSVNVPAPAWGRIAWASLGTVVGSGRPLRLLKRGYRMLRYGRWLSAQARAGRFHYLPADAVADRLRAAGFVSVGHRPSYRGQAWVFTARRAG